ncbi:MAG: SprT-like domain-containing protein [Kangiellaceae bacterium]|nr:SprT-like domain-containing protein [Kangiellaceae bacterium]MCW8997565.1 SprT-like domain-containing protein [Kangiellaceae bacterium]
MSRSGEVRAAIILANNIKEQLAFNRPYLTGWEIRIDRAKRRAGSCRTVDKIITLSQSHILENDVETITDTILHELAHAICFVEHKDLSHGVKWKHIAKTIGATPRATGKFNTPKSPWKIVLVDFRTKKIRLVAERYRRSKKIMDFYLKDDVTTKGNLFYLSSKEYDSFIKNEVQFNELKLIQ